MTAYGGLGSLRYFGGQQFQAQPDPDTLVAIFAFDQIVYEHSRTHTNRF